MVRITFIEHGGAEHIVQAETGQSVMQAAMNNFVPGILADCGGSGTCGTCHVYIDPAWSNRVSAISPAEREVIEGVLEPQPTSRLSCQITVGVETDGLIVRLPSSQF
jgi:2Fe-2S ferredoxin